MQVENRKAHSGFFFLEIWWVFKEGEKKRGRNQTGDEKGQNEVKTARKEK